MSHHQSSQRVNPGFFARLQAFFVFCIARLAYILLYLKHRLKPHRLDAVRANIASIFPGLPIAKQRRIAHQYYRYLAHNSSSYITMALLPPSSAPLMVNFDNIHYLEKLYAEKRNVAILIPHYDVWSYIATLNYFTDYKILGAYASTPKGDTLSKIRGKYGNIIIRNKRFYKTIMQNPDDEPSLYIILPDQVAVPPYKRSVRFFDRNIYVQSGAERIIKNTNALAFFLDVKENSTYNFTYHFTPLNNFPGDTEQVLEKFFTRVEAKIKAKPGLWRGFRTTLWNPELNPGLPDISTINKAL